MKGIAIDFGGTWIKSALVHDGVVVDKSSIPAESGSGIQRRLGAVEIEVHRLLERHSTAMADYSGIGIAFPGLVNPDTKQVISISAKYDDATGFSFEDWARKAFGIPVILENDAKAALLGEITYGSAAGEADAVLMTFGTGIGTAAVINGQLLRGKHNQAGCLGGHLTTNVYGNACTCGNVGCAEAHASSGRLPQIAQTAEGFGHSLLAAREKFDYIAVLDASLAGDPFAVRLLEDLIRHWSAAIVNLVHAYDAEVIILSGGLMKSQERILPQIIRQVRQHAWTPWGELRFVVARDPEASVLLGLFSLLYSKWSENK